MADPGFPREGGVNHKGEGAWKWKTLDPRVGISGSTNAPRAKNINSELK